MFWSHKPSRQEPYAESRNGLYRIAITPHGHDDDGNEVYQYTAFVKVGSGGKVDKIWDRLGDISTDAEYVKKLCVSHSRTNPNAKRSRKR